VLTLLTPTGCRSAAWALCERWMARQTYAGPVRWVVVDDGAEAQPVTFAREGWELEVIRPGHRWSPGKNTQARNFLAGLDRIGPEAHVAVIEDDDYYAPDWLDKVAEELRTASMVGQGWNRYYHVRTGAIRENTNDRHASLCATAFRDSALGLFRRQCERAPRLIDQVLWKHVSSRRVFHGKHVIGMKGLPGRAGIAGGHEMKTAEPFDLRQWIGDDAEHYRQFR
jgi:hypothetical protein